jgi:plastocyanin
MSVEQTTEQDKDYAKRPLWQWIVIYILIGGFVYAGVYYLLLAKKGGYNYNQQGQYQSQPAVDQTVSPTTTQASDALSQSEVVVVYGSSGFLPSKVTIKSGSRIRWVNESDRDVRIGVDPHPIHTGSRELSGGEFTLDLRPSEERVVVMSKVGTFGYHNHLNASETGTIVVE